MICLPSSIVLKYRSIKYRNELLGHPVQVDTSKVSQGAGILQDEHPIAYASRFLIPAEEN